MEHSIELFILVLFGLLKFWGKYRRNSLVGLDQASFHVLLDLDNLITLRDEIRKWGFFISNYVFTLRSFLRHNELSIRFMWGLIRIGVVLVLGFGIFGQDRTVYYMGFYRTAYDFGKKTNVCFSGTL